MSKYVEVRVGAQLGVGGKIANTRIMFNTDLDEATQMSQAKLLLIANAAAQAVDDNVADFTTGAISISTTARGVNLVDNPDYDPGPPEVGMPFKLAYDTLTVGNSAPVIGNGTKAGTVLPPQCAVVVTLRTNSPGRARRGRMYWFPPIESDVSDVGLIGGADYLTVTQQIIDDVEALGAAADNPDACVASTRFGDSEQIVSIDQGTRIDTQRRRLPRTIR